MATLPNGTVTFLFTDIESSTKLLQDLGDEKYARVLAQHRSILREAFQAHGGIEVDTQGDAFFVAFIDAQGAVDAARQAQLALKRGPVAVRMGIHSGEPLVWGEGYVGEDVHRGARICASAHGGQVVVSERTREVVDAQLVDLGLHRLKDLSEPQHLFQVGEGDFPPLRTLYRTNLPVQPSPLVGRVRELAETSELLAAHRLVTLTGAGGSGKTRLALQLAADVADDYPDGVYWIPLQAIRDAELVPHAIASAVGAKNGLSEHIADGKVLLLLDNLEQVIGAAPFLAELLSRTPNLKMIATSREPLRIAAERRHPVEPLPQADAVALFSERALAVDPAFEPTAAVADICARLDNLPLALELAAARVAVLDPDSLLARLEHSLPVLTHGARDAPERQRTLRATIEWSYNLLGLGEQAQFARLSVFAGSFDSESAQSVAGVDLDAIQALVEKSLVRHWGRGRFGMLDTIHEFALERFAELPDHAQVQQWHAEHFIGLAETARPELRGWAHGMWLDRFETERENFRAALDWSADSGRLDLTCRLAAGFGLFWVNRGPHAEALKWIELTLPARGTLSPEDRAPYLTLASMFAARFDEDRAWALCEEALALSREEGDLEGEGFALMQMAQRAHERGRVDEAYGLLEQSADVYRRLGTGWGLPGVVMNLGNLASERGDYERAEQLYTESLVSYRALNSPINIVAVLVNLADVTVDRGLPREAAELLREALDIAVAIKNHYLLTYVLNIFSRVAVAEGAWERAAVLVGARDHLLEETGGRFDRRDEQRALAERETVEAELGTAAFAKAWAEGGAMELDAVLRYVGNGG